MLKKSKDLEILSSITQSQIAEAKEMIEKRYLRLPAKRRYT